MRVVWFELNGETRAVSVEDKNAAIEVVHREKASSDPGSVSSLLLVGSYLTFSARLARQCLVLFSNSVLRLAAKSRLETQSLSCQVGSNSALGDKMLISFRSHEGTFRLSSFTDCH